MLIRQTTTLTKQKKNHTKTNLLFVDFLGCDGFRLDHTH